MELERDSRVEIGTLDTAQVQAITYIDQVFFTESRIPDANEVADKVGYLPEAIEDWFRDRQFCNALRVRGVDLSLKEDPENITPMQAAASHIVVNTEDRRSLNEKLTSIGVTMLEWQGWVAQPRFRQYLRKRAVQANDVTTTMALLKLEEQVADGDFRATELQLRMAGLYNPTTRVEVNIQQVMVSIVEIIQKHVRDPKIIGAIAEDIEILERKSLSG